MQRSGPAVRQPRTPHGRWLRARRQGHPGGTDGSQGHADADVPALGLDHGCNSRHSRYGSRHPRLTLCWARFSRLEPVAPPDYVEHDLVGAGADAVEAGVAEGTLDLVLLHVSVAA